MDRPPKGPPPQPERTELPMQHKPPDAPELVFAPKPMVASSSGFQPRLEAVYPDTGRPDRRIETGHADGWRYHPNVRHDASMRSQMTLGRSQPGAMPSLPSQRPASFVTRNSDIWSQTQGKGLFSTPLGNDPSLHPVRQEEEIDHGYETREKEQDLEVDRCVLRGLLIQRQTTGPTGEACVFCAILLSRSGRSDSLPGSHTDFHRVSTDSAPRSWPSYSDNEISLSQVTVLCYPELPSVERNGVRHYFIFFDLPLLDPFRPSPHSQRVNALKTDVVRASMMSRDRSSPVFRFMPVRIFIQMVQTELDSRAAYNRLRDRDHLQVLKTILHALDSHMRE
eukprot:1809087-Pleurochrysis_carterae.AAC.4